MYINILLTFSNLNNFQPYSISRFDLVSNSQKPTNHYHIKVPHSENQNQLRTLWDLQMIELAPHFHKLTSLKPQTFPRHHMTEMEMVTASSSRVRISIRDTRPQAKDASDQSSGNIQWEKLSAGKKTTQPSAGNKVRHKLEGRCRHTNCEERIQHQSKIMKTCSWEKDICYFYISLCESVKRRRNQRRKILTLSLTLINIISYRN